jgi:2-polyprenyl-3-methyl-5-hydroxy-6-metoxy-1,4-benzoquinol methylase
VGNPTLLSMVQEKLWSVNRERWFRRVVSGRRHARPQGFFDSYPLFFSSSVIAPPDRINQRHRALIQSNTEILSGLRVLDLASHDGRWSFAAHKAGAEYVLGIEARPHLVDAARRNMLSYGVAKGRVEFVQGDVLLELDRLESGRFDTVLCLGFLYHIIDHMVLLRKIARIRPKNLVIDTSISTRPGVIIEVNDESVEHESAAAFGDPGNPVRAIKGKPSRPALELMLKAVGFSGVRYWDWLNAGIRRWDDLEDYYLGRRVSLRATSGV